MSFYSLYEIIVVVSSWS